MSILQTGCADNVQATFLMTVKYGVTGDGYTLRPVMAGRANGSSCA